MENAEMNTDLIKKFVKFCQKKMGIKNLPKIKLTKKRDEITTTAGYVRGKKIIIYTNGRHQVDVCRSIAHELKHHKQWEDKEFNDTESIQDVGGKFEDEANAVAGEMIKQFAYSGNMNIYESRKIITEGRIEDAKKEFPSTSPDLIKYISSKDPSGNNKYLRWILKQLRSSVLLHPDEDQKSILDDIIEKLGVYNKLLPYYKNNLDTRSLPEKVLKNPKDINNYDNIDTVSLVNDMLMPIYLEKKQDEQQIRETDVVYTGDDYLVVHIKTLQEMCYYGKDNKWCRHGIGTENDFDETSTNNYVFVIQDKTNIEPKNLGKYVVLLSKTPNIKKYIEIYDGEDNPITIEELKLTDIKLDSLIHMIEMWKEGLKDIPVVSIKNKNPELYALTQFLGDENLKHYSQNPFSIIPCFDHNNGKIKQTYYIGDLEQIKPEVQSVYSKQINKHPNLLLRHQVDQNHCL